MIPLFIADPKVRPGGPSAWWLGRSLASLQESFLRKKSRLILRRGNAPDVLAAVVRETGAAAVLWDESFDPVQRKIDEAVHAKLTRAGIFCGAFNDSLLYDPRTVRNKQGTPFKVFTPFWNHCLSLEEPAAPVKFNGKLIAPSVWPRSEKLESLGFVSRAQWTEKIGRCWDPGEKGAKAVLQKFLRNRVADYSEGRDHPAKEGTSRLSPYLHFGEISARQVWHETRQHMIADRRPGIHRTGEAFLRQIVWREFAHHMLFHFPESVIRPLRKDFLKFQWRKDARLLRAWQKGETGYPIVDAGMRQLWATGWMHNRVRMIAASFLVKDLLQPWQEGAAWFMETLVDADLANNTFGWQWVAGCGADAAPYFRIFNPVLQGNKFDSEGDYVRRWIPELSRVPARFIHQPWEAPSEVLASAGVQLDKNYPAPIVDHAAGRKRALLAYHRMSEQRQK